VLRALLPPAERDEIIEDLAAEHDARVLADGPAVARRWLWRQTLQSTPALLRWSWWRGTTGFEPRANAFRPGGHMLTNWITDARYAVRRLRTRPAYTIVAVLTLALGIGGTAAVFGIARPLIFDPLPYANADSVAIFWFSGSWNEREFTELRGKFPGFRNVAAYRPGDVTMRDGDAPSRRIPGIGTSTELFDVLGVRPFLGPGFSKGEDAQTAEPVAVLSYGLWQELGADPAMVGKRITVDGSPRTVVGVMPRGFWFPDPSVRVWMTWPINPQGQNGSWTLVGHVAPGQDVRQMQAPLAQLTAEMGKRFEYSEKWDKTKNAAVTPIRDELLGGMRPAIVATFVAMGLILLIACANVAALMLGQIEGRATELAVRSALGATRRRLTQQLVLETLLLGVLAGVVGGGLAAAGFKLLAGALPLGAWAESANFDWTLFAVALVIAVVAVMLVVLIPLVSLWRDDLRDALHRARTGGIQGRGGRLERGLVIAEVALAMLIASGAALLARSVTKLYAIDPGVETSSVAVIDLVPSAALNNVQRRQGLEEIVEAVREIPGVTTAAAAMKLPLRGPGNSFDITIDGHPELPPSTTFFRMVTRDYFQTMGIKLRAGRTFDISDRPTPPPTASSTGAATPTTAAPARPPVTEVPIVVNEALAKKYFPNENAVGKLVGGGYGIAQRIVGVVANVAEGALTDPPEPARYYLAGTVSWFSPQAVLVMRTARPSDAAAVLDAARRTVQRVAPSFAIQESTTMQRIMDIAVGPARQVMSLLSLLSALALILGAIGIYGVISHFALRRKRDWAIRVALGLPGSRVVTHIVGQGVALVVVGIVLGAIGTAALGKLLASFLFGISSVDPLAFALASGALLVIGAAAAFLPARRAGTVDPAMVLREQ
jgi:predicted permease